jgi:glucosamine 6-phosphate synthetase-like amidotransferase/phosphosugar isomerase protein
VCGIAGFHIRDKYRSKLTDADLNRLVDGLLMGIEPRGKDATGYVAVDRKQGTFFEKRDVRAEHFVTVRKRIPASAKTVLLHTRATTKGTEKDN